jgi:hypothetical protein
MNLYFYIHVLLSLPIVYVYDFLHIILKMSFPICTGNWKAGNEKETFWYPLSLM